MKKVNIAIMGFGIVGGGTYDILTGNYKMIADSTGFGINVKRVLDLDTQKIIDKGIAKEVATKNFEDIVNDPDISVVVETMGGVEPARGFILRCLEAGKSVVTANKELLAKHWAELKSAETDSARIFFEASCAGGIPIIRTLEQGMQANNITQIMGIINGTTNFILDKMSEEGLSYSDALKIAQDLGYAEANPAADVEGYDAMYKLSILSSLAFGKHIPYTGICREGIDKISARDIAEGKAMGYTLKLLGIAQNSDGKIEARVNPAFVPDKHPLAGVRGAFNAVYLKGDYVGDIMLYGSGAGAHPTGSAIVSDVIVAIGMRGKKAKKKVSKGEPKFNYNYSSKYYFSITAEDKAGSLAKVTALLGKCGVSLASLVQKEVTNGQAYISFLTHCTYEQSMQKAIGEITKLDCVSSVESLIRVI
ncbi:MAG: homoserine dehydrogenase [Firmicutes bacterium]|nr:homoserine dehydrogenase [Bacillota bacterium]